jgi:hypothetical protein
MLPTSTYPMWYNVIPLFVSLDLNLYPSYPIRTKGLDSLICNYKSYVPRNVYPIFEQPVIPPTYIPNSIGNQFRTMVQLVISKEIQLVQQLVIASLYKLLEVYQLMYPNIMIISHQMEDNFKIHLEEVYP